MTKVDIWIKGRYNNQDIIGRTCVINNKKSVVIITEDARSFVVDYNNIQNILKITFQTSKEIKENKTTKDLINELITRKEKQN